MPAAPACRQEFSVLQSDSPQCENRNFAATGLVKSVETFWGGSRRILFFEDGGEEG